MVIFMALMPILPRVWVLMGHIQRWNRRQDSGTMVSGGSDLTSVPLNKGKTFKKLSKFQPIKGYGRWVDLSHKWLSGKKREAKTPQRILIHGLSPSIWVVVPEKVQVKDVVKKWSHVGSDPRFLGGTIPYHMLRNVPQLQASNVLSD